MADALVERELAKAATCEDCGRRLKAGVSAVASDDLAVVLCLECVTLETRFVLGTAGAGARREHERRQGRREERIRSSNPRLGGLILALSDEPQHIQAWERGAVGEEVFGGKLDEEAGPELMILHDRKLPRSRANVDHLAVTPAGVWILDAKRYKGRVETRGHGLFSKQPPDLFVGGRNKMKLVEGVQRQAEIVSGILAAFAEEAGVAEVPVRGALVFIDAEFGLFGKPFSVRDTWVGWGKAIRARLREESGEVPVADVAKRLARELRPG